MFNVSCNYFLNTPKFFFFSLISCLRSYFMLQVSSFMFDVLCSLLQKYSYFMVIVAYFKYCVSYLLFNVSCNYFPSTPKIFFCPLVSCLRSCFMFQVPSFMFDVLCSLLRKYLYFIFIVAYFK